MKFEQCRVSTLALVLLVPLSALGCVSTDEKADNSGGSSSTAGSSTGGSTSMSGSSNTSGSSSGGSGGGSNTDVDPLAVACPSPTAALITDFTFMDMVDGMAASKTDASFGDFTNLFSGSTYVYPGAGMNHPLTSDVTGDNWHVSGEVGDYSGFGISFNKCTKVDASAYKGISFTISGSVEMSGTVTFTVGTAGDDVSSAWLNMNKMAGDDDKHTFARCTPASATNQYDGTCNSPTKVVTVSDKPTTVTVMWSDLKGGKPEASVNPAEITFVSWVFPPPPGAGTDSPTPYMADVTLDDLTFVE